MKTTKRFVFVVAVSLLGCAKISKTGLNDPNSPANLTQNKGSHIVINCEQCDNPILKEFAKTDNIAMIVEPREHKLLIPIIHNVMSVLDASWKIQIFHGIDNESLLKKHFSNEIIENKIILSRMEVHNINIDDYNGLMLDYRFWQKVMGENILLFQTDTVLCKHATHKIDYFFKYDYIGAPWAWPFPCPKEITNETIRVGNGGLSFRKRSKFIKVLKELPPMQGINEDLIFACIGTKKTDLLVPSIDIAKTFSVETIYDPTSVPLGVHKPWPYLNSTELKALGKSCHEMDSILKPYYKW